MISIEKKRGILNSIRYFLAPRDLFENVAKLENELREMRVEKETEIRFARQLLEIGEKKIKEKELLIAELKKELAEIKINAPAKIEEERKRRQSENVHTILNPKQSYHLRKAGGLKPLEPLKGTKKNKNKPTRNALTIL